MSLAYDRHYITATCSVDCQCYSMSEVSSFAPDESKSPILSIR